MVDRNKGCNERYTLDVITCTVVAACSLARAATVTEIGASYSASHWRRRSVNGFALTFQYLILY